MEHLRTEVVHNADDIHWDVRKKEDYCVKTMKTMCLRNYELGMFAHD